MSISMVNNDVCDFSLARFFCSSFHVDLVLGAFGFVFEADKKNSHVQFVHVIFKISVELASVWSKAAVSNEILKRNG